MSLPALKESPQRKNKRKMNYAPKDLFKDERNNPNAAKLVDQIH